ncbi:MAG: hypothetical protein ACRDE8_14265 [Ginsengibacter sp.]
MVLLIFKFSGNKTKRGSGQYQQIGSSLLYQGKIPFLYAINKVSIERLPA